jgi:hypothetical protein
MIELTPSPTTSPAARARHDAAMRSIQSSATKILDRQMQPIRDIVNKRLAPLNELARIQSKDIIKRLGAPNLAELVGTQRLQEAFRPKWIAEAFEPKFTWTPKTAAPVSMAPLDADFFDAAMEATVEANDRRDAREVRLEFVQWAVFALTVAALVLAIIALWRA